MFDHFPRILPAVRPCRECGALIGLIQCRGKTVPAEARILARGAEGEEIHLRRSFDWAHSVERCQEFKRRGEHPPLYVRPGVLKPGDRI